MSEKVDTYAHFWNREKEEPDWSKVRRLNTYLTFRQKICALYLLKDKKVRRNPPGKNKLKDVIFNREYRQLNGERFFLNPYNSNLSELQYLKNLCERILNQNLDKIPSYSCLIEITFKLKKPYHSKDDDSFYVIDNPIVKERIFKLPMVRATTWKGALRFATLKVFEEEFKEDNWKEKRALLVRLFGNEKDATEKYLNEIAAKKIKRDKNKANEIGNEFKEYLLEKGYISKEIASKTGRLSFYPTFFNNVSLDVITPLNREAKTPARGRGPIYFEIVPAETKNGRSKGIFKLLYYPFDLIAKGKFDKIEKETKEDFEFLAKALRKMFYEIGFSAKKTSGFGTTEVEEIKIKPGDKMHKTVEKTKDIFEAISEFKGKMKIEEDGKHEEQN